MRNVLIVAAAVGIVAGMPSATAQARALAAPVYYRDQSGTSLPNSDPAQAVNRASQQLGFSVRTAATWPGGSRLRALWVMERHAPRFVVLYYGGDNGYINCQVHESLNGTSVVFGLATVIPITIGKTQGTLRQVTIGGGYPVSELVWHAHGVRYDLLGSVNTSLAMLIHMATTL